MIGPVYACPQKHNIILTVFGILENSETRIPLLKDCIINIYKLR